MRIQLSGSQNSWANLLMLSRLQLEQLELPGSVEQIILTTDQFVDMPMGMFNLDLFGDSDSAQQSCDLIDSLNARLGIEALSQPVLNQDYLPEQASTLAAPGQHIKTTISRLRLAKVWNYEFLSGIPVCAKLFSFMWDQLEK